VGLLSIGGPSRIATGIWLSGGNNTRETLEPGGTTSTIRAPGQTSTSVRGSQPSTSL
jgi:hypothetical protein